MYLAKNHEDPHICLLLVGCAILHITNQSYKFLTNKMENNTFPSYPRSYDDLIGKRSQKPVKAIKQGRHVRQIMLYTCYTPVH